MSQTLNAQGAFQLKGSLFTLMVMQLSPCDETQLRAQLEQTTAQAPNFFQQTPIILDLEKFDHCLELGKIKHILLEYGLIAVAVKNLDNTLLAEATQAGLGLIKPGATQSDGHQTTSKHTVTKLINKPVRSGQQIYAPDGDLIITASISPGAELLAAGNIHIYGSLRGRALAGINGNSHARIYCQDLSAELVSIAGIYQLSDHLPKFNHQHSIQIRLENDQLVFDEL